MIERKVWAKEEDEVLRQIYQVRKIKKWSSVARCMEAEFHMPGRSGKQCRERWYNQLSPSVIQNKEWTGEEQRELFELHEQLGNRWADIAKKLFGRTDNSVKNHFYSTLRRGMRRLNRFVTMAKSNYRMMSNVLISKIVNVADDRFEARKMVDVTDQQRQQSSEIVKGLIELSGNTVNDNATEDLERKLADKVLEFSRSYKKKRPKKKKRQFKEDQVDSLHTGQTTSEVIPQRKERRFRMLLLKNEVEKSVNRQEQPPADLFVGLTPRNQIKSPSSPIFLGDSMNMLGMGSSMKLPFPFECQIPFAGVSNVSLDESFTSGIPAPRFTWATGNENMGLPRVSDTNPISLD